MRASGALCLTHIKEVRGEVGEENRGACSDHAFRRLLCHSAQLVYARSCPSVDHGKLTRNLIASQG